MAVTHIRIDPAIHGVFKDFCDSNGRELKGTASIAIVRWLQSEGVDVEYSRPKAQQPKQAA